MPTTERTPHRRRRRNRLAIATAALVLAIGAGVWAVVGLAPVLVPAGCRVAGPDGASVRLDLDQAANAATIAGIAVSRSLPERAAVIAIATAMQESKLRNLDRGDRDSLGLFQQRPSQGWGTPEQVRDTRYATRAFFAGLVQVRDYDRRPLTEVAQEVQRSGYPEAYADHEAEAVLLARAFTGADPTSLTCRIDPPATAAAPGTVEAQIRATFGVRSRVSGPRLLVDTDTTRGAGAIAAWALAHAARYGIGSVSVTEHTWTAGRTDAATRWTATPGDGSSARRAVVRLGSPDAP